MNYDLRTNPSYNRSFIQKMITNHEIRSHLLITFTDGDYGTSKTLYIFENMEYKFTFYDGNFGDKRTALGLVTNVGTSVITVKVLASKQVSQCKCCDMASKCDFKNKPVPNMPPMPTCGCIFNSKDTSEYNDPITYQIPIQNLMDAEYVIDRDKMKQNKKEGVRVMLLGISANIVRAIVVQLKFFDDMSEDSFKYVELKVGNVYDVSYADPDGTIFEITGKVTAINELEESTDTTTSTTIVREEVGMYNSVKTSCCTPKEDYMKSDPIKKKIQIELDTSSTFDGEYQYLYLNDIRDCTLVSEAEDGDTTSDTSTKMCCECCPYKTNSESSSDED